MKWFTTTEPGFPAAFAALLDEARQTTAQVDTPVAAIIAAIRAGGDEALCAYTAQFDGHTPTPATLRVTQAEIDTARAAIAPDLAAALDLAATRIEAFHRAQMPVDMQMHDDAGVTMGLRWGALDAIGIYVPGGRAAYPSSVLMNALPATRRRRAPHCHVRPLPGRRAQPAGAGRRPPRRGNRDLPRRRRAGHRRAGLRHGDDRAGGPHRRPGQRLRRRGQAPGVRAMSA